MRVEIRNLTKTFDAYTALDEVSLDVREGEFCALLGPSGSGKTTLLRIIAGLEFPDRGEVRFAGEDMVRRDARERQVGFVFQHYALFRHMSVFENVAFGLRVRPRRVRPAEVQIRERVMELLRLVQLKRFACRYPNQLSGGQRQRVALARALAIEPRILLLDEPFGALDAKVRKDLRRWLRDLHRRLGLTSVFVTHDQEEALELADQVVLMREGTDRADRQPAADLRPSGHALRLRVPRQRQPPALPRPGRAGSTSRVAGSSRPTASASATGRRVCSCARTTSRSSPQGARRECLRC